jgi:uncharacterized membrane protein YjgN (DUF898 family)
LWRKDVHRCWCTGGQLGIVLVRGKLGWGNVPVKREGNEMSDTSTTGASVPSASPPPLPVGRGEPVGIAWSGPTWGLWRLGLFNLCLNVITLGFYNFWAKTEVRRRLVSSIRIAGEPMEYTGTGKELFLGFLIVFAIILLPFLILSYVAQLTLGQAGGAAMLPLYLGIGYLYGVAVYRARRYRRSRLRWRGVRGALVGSSWGFGWGYYWTSLASGFTFGWLTPWRDNFLHRSLIQDTRFGDRPFKYAGHADELYPRYAIAWFGSSVLFLVMFALVAGLIVGMVAALPQPVRDSITAGFKAANQNGRFDFQAPVLREHMGLWIGMAGVGVAGLVIYILLANLLWSLFYALEYRYFTSQTTLEGLRFKLDVHAWSMFWLFFSNTLMSLATLTILGPVAEARVARHFIRRMSAEGTIDFASILQSQERLSKTGEGLAEAFDVEPNAYFILSI